MGMEMVLSDLVQTLWERATIFWGPRRLRMVCGLQRGRRDPGREVGGDRREDGVGNGRGDTGSQAGATTLLLQQKTIDGVVKGVCKVIVALQIRAARAILWVSSELSVVAFALPSDFIKNVTSSSAEWCVSNSLKVSNTLARVSDISNTWSPLGLRPRPANVTRASSTNSFSKSAPEATTFAFLALVWLMLS